METIGLVFGGKSPEHEISILSARNIYSILKEIPVDVQNIYLDRKGAFYLIEGQGFPAESELELLESIEDDSVSMDLGRPRAIALSLHPGTKAPLRRMDNQVSVFLDSVFCIVHGNTGEDGILQGLFHCLDLPFVGCDVFASSLGMDKSAMKVHLERAGIPSAKYRVALAHQRNSLDLAEVEKSLGYPMFVKPARQGSSVGVSRATDRAGLERALEEAFRFDTCVLVEEQINGKEVECAVLGNESPEASIIGQIIPKDQFYSYESKYLDADGAKLLIPADITEEESKTIQQLAKKTFAAMYCEGLARIDCFLTEDGTAYINEINTLPGFTNISMYPTLWEKSGLRRPELLRKLLDLGYARKKRQDSLATRH
ncbi:MAG: D-alanine--D-alanine ligase [Leptospiraceae bacterium]|nr:D-alanine--D-alanine ligase [Leptospiraceae bacterium]MCB1304788.1 D-alanine--D-alanine ligase [Leptospiraceae bacterium]